MELGLWFYIAFVVVLFAFGAIVSLICWIRNKNKELDLPSTSISLNWKNPCANCGEKGGTHRFEGKKYCARCHAKLYAEKKCGADNNKLNQD